VSAFIRSVCALIGSLYELHRKAQRMPTAQEMPATLRGQVMAEVEAESWGLEEIGRQLGSEGKPLSKRQIHNYIRFNGMPTFLTPDGRRRGDPSLIRAWLRNRLSGPQTQN
jgi:hypothetical protein